MHGHISNYTVWVGGGGVCFVKRPEISGTAGDWPSISGADDAKNGPFRKY